MSNEIAGLGIGCRDFSEEALAKLHKAVKYAQQQHLLKVKKQKAKRK